MFFRYTRYLEQQVKELRDEKQKLQDRNDELIKVLVPMLRKTNEPKPTVTAGDIISSKKIHKIDIDGSRAKCACSWSEVREDPGELQNLISAHLRESRVALAGGRKSWPQAKAALENHAEKEQTT